MKRVVGMVALAMLLALGACPAGSKQPTPDQPITEDQGSGRMSDMTKKPTGSGSFVRGAAVSPAAALITWLDAQKLGDQPRLLRLPVVLQRGQTGFSTRGAKIGGGADAVEIYVNDAALGIGVAQQARSLCPTEPTCAVWLEGYWRGKQDDAYTFDAMKLHAPIAADAVAAASHAEVEGESGN